MKINELIKSFCQYVEDTDIESFKRLVIECVVQKDQSTVIFGTDGEFHYLYAAPFREEKEKVHYFAKQFEGDTFEQVYSIEVPEGYWIYEYSTDVNFYEFRRYDSLETAKTVYENKTFSLDELLLEKALFYLTKDKKECLFYHKRNASHERDGHNES